ncbi:MAG: adenylate kinase [Candidatus Midichloria sp.]|nr:MAG: adenylate kinase [Candidatus Midichloria sp.]
MRLILLGAPGVGKGTQGIKLAEFYNILKLSTGEILRSEVNSETELGLHIAEVLKKGMLVSDDIVEKIVADRLLNGAECRNGFILDGFPRTLHQAVYLSKILQELPADDAFVINIEMDFEKLISRLSNRLTCVDCSYTFNGDIADIKLIACPKCGSKNCYQRDDDKKESIIKRLAVYNELTKPMIDYYSDQSDWIEVDGDNTIDFVFNSIIASIKQKTVV